MITIEKQRMHKFGLVGKNISYSFSKTFFSEKFEKENLTHSYENFDLESIQLFPKILSENKNLKGLNVTIPYKQTIISYLDSLDTDAETIGAVNTVKILDGNKLKGFNTDHFGFQKSLEEFLPLKQKTALIFGTGGSSKAIAFALKNLGFEFQFVSRKKNSCLKYTDLNKAIIEKYLLLINCTPLGTFPNVEQSIPIPYQFITKNHLLFDLVYNPSETAFLKLGKQQGASISNGRKMLEFQAEKSWEIWNS